MPFTNSFSSSLKSSVTEFGCSDKMAITVALCSPLSVFSVKQELNYGDSNY